MTTLILVQVTSFSQEILIGGFCSFVGKGRLRAVGYGSSGPGALVTFPATK